MGSQASVLDRIRAEDPSYNLFETWLDHGGDMHLLKRAMSRVNHDGKYGPYSDVEWSEIYEYEPMSVEDALEVLKEADRFIEDYDCDDWTIDADEIGKCVWSFVIEIYGRIPW